MGKAYTVLLVVFVVIIGIFLWKAKGLRGKETSLVAAINAELKKLGPTDPDKLVQQAGAKSTAPTPSGASAPSAQALDTATSTGAGAAAVPADVSTTVAPVAAAAPADVTSAAQPSAGSLGEALKRAREKRAAQDQQLEKAISQ